MAHDIRALLAFVEHVRRDERLAMVSPPGGSAASWIPRLPPHNPITPGMRRYLEDRVVHMMNPADAQEVLEALRRAEAREVSPREPLYEHPGPRRVVGASTGLPFGVLS